MKSTHKPLLDDDLFGDALGIVEQAKDDDHLAAAIHFSSELAIEVSDLTVRRKDGLLRAIQHPVEMAAIEPKTRRLTLLSRKIWLFLVSYALENLGAQESGGIVWRVGLQTLLRDVDYRSHDLEYFKESILECQKVLVDWSSSVKKKDGSIRTWSSTQLLGSVEFVIDSSARQCIEWSFTPVLYRQILERKHYFSVDLQVVTLVRRSATLALYWLACRYKTNPTHLTARMPWREWAPILTGESEEAAKTATLLINAERTSKFLESDVDSGESGAEASGSPKNLKLLKVKYEEYRFFNRDVIKPAVIEINQVQCEFWIEAVTHKKIGARSVGDLQFKIHLRSDFKPVANRTSSRAKSDAIGVLQDLGYTFRIADELCNEYTAELCLQVASVASKRIADPGQEPIRNPAGYFLEELKVKARTLDKASAVSPVAPPVILTPDEAMGEAMAQYRKSLREKAKIAWPTMTAEQQSAYLQAFEQDRLASAAQSVIKVYKKSSINTPLTAGLFYPWLAEQIAGDAWTINALELLTFKRNNVSSTDSAEGAS